MAIIRKKSSTAKTEKKAPKKTTQKASKEEVKAEKKTSKKAETSTDVKKAEKPRRKRVAAKPLKIADEKAAIETPLKTLGLPEACNPLILRFYRLMDAFAKADDERDFYLDRAEGFILYVDLDKTQEELDALLNVLEKNEGRFCPVPKMTFYEQKKLMEGFVHEKVYDIDTKEKLLDLIQSNQPREAFLEFLLDQEVENEKWQQYYQERSRVRIIEWLRNMGLRFVFEEDLEFTKSVLEKVKQQLFIKAAVKEVVTARKAIETKSRSYYSNEALNPRPKRGRPPKQVVKVEIEPQISADIFTTVPQGCYPFLYLPEIPSAQSITFSSKFSTQEQLVSSFRSEHQSSSAIARLEELSQKLSGLTNLNGDSVISLSTSKNINWDSDDDDNLQANLMEYSKSGTRKRRKS